ncbi:MAG: RNA 2',3'-cyclic phosphodiesterase [Lachnospiraceae bacterium]|nr:RNA 2',3'-cyclic phosphodiesterase [Lachnospiraceae bacterium]MBQ9562977.1 RNA 2',3'-cyclic phosphodiesterase [Lachnospiraceae bacterium]MBQ9593635.1 RNA 2',3'-cyclic phosphodiesterase [Lachnospiraceae bacterium]MBR0152234.1 RNA 2',3'-cyclic phosphodiesterase [Lachnospiraceae bacterium]
MRLFLAIDLSAEMKAALTETMHALKKQGVRGKYVPSRNLHLTLAFLGECRSAEPVKEALAGVKCRGFRLSLAAPGTFGNILWAGVKGNQGLAGLAREVRGALDAAGISYDRKEFAPHITLVREMSGRWQGVPAPKGEMTVKGISLMKSETKDGKTVYTEIARLG